MPVADATGLPANSNRTYGRVLPRQSVPARRLVLEALELPRARGGRGCPSRVGRFRRKPFIQLEEECCEQHL